MTRQGVRIPPLQLHTSEAVVYMYKLPDIQRLRGAEPPHFLVCRSHTLASLHTLGALSTGHYCVSTADQRQQPTWMSRPSIRPVSSSPSSETSDDDKRVRNMPGYFL